MNDVRPLYTWGYDSGGLWVRRLADERRVFIPRREPEGDEPATFDVALNSLQAAEERGPQDEDDTCLWWFDHLEAGG